jgi:tetratricopeptide (TPR) repeat protein
MRRCIYGFVLTAALLALAATGCKNALLSGGILHFDQKRYERAREVLLNATHEEPANAEAWLWLGKAYAELDSTSQARATLAHAATLQSPKFPEMQKQVDDVMAHYWSVKHNNGLVLAKAASDAKISDKPAEAKKNFRDALNEFAKAREYGPDKSETPRNMGVCYFNLGQPDSGLIMLSLSHKLAPNDEKSKEMLFDQYRKLGDQAASQTDAAGNTSLEGLMNSVKFYSAADSLRPNDPDLLFSLGVVHYQLAEADTMHKAEHYAKAIEAFENDLQAKPDDQEALYNAASLYLEMKQCDKGLERAKTLLDLDPKKGRYHDIVGRLYYCQGNKTERVAGIVFQRSLQPVGDATGVTSVSVDDFRAHLGQADATSDMVKKYREEGKPEEVRTFNDNTSGAWETWFYWSRGRAYAFQNGALKYSRTFKPVKPAATGTK